MMKTVCFALILVLLVSGCAEKEAMPVKEPACKDECNLGQIKCEANARGVCGDFNQDFCLEWHMKECPLDTYCSEGVCLPKTSTCKSECTLNEKFCIDDTTKKICGNFDEDSCLEWLVKKCPEESFCEGGKCINEFKKIEESPPAIKSTAPKQLQPVCQTNADCLPKQVCNRNIFECVPAVCLNDADCDDDNFYTADKCINQNDFSANESSAAECVHTKKLTGDMTYKLLIVEFAPENVQYSKLYFCRNDIIGHYIQNLEQYCDNKFEEHGFIELLNNPQKQFKFDNVREADRQLNPYSLYYINDFFQREAKTYGVSTVPYFDITILGPYTLDELPPKTSFDWDKVDPFFNKKIEEFKINTSEYDFVTVIYMDDKDLSSLDRHKFENHADGKMIYISALTSEPRTSKTSWVLIHELLHSFGAIDKYVFGESGQYPWCLGMTCCLDPEGIPEPNKVPKYPQTKACIMCASGIVIEYGKTHQGAHLDNTLMCDKTAEEIGWK